MDGQVGLSVESTSDSKTLKQTKFSEKGYSGMARHSRARSSQSAAPQNHNVGSTSAEKPGPSGVAPAIVDASAPVENNDPIVTKAQSDAADHRRKVAIETLQLPKEGTSDVKQLLNYLRAPCETRMDLVKRVVAFIAVGFSSRPTLTQEADQNSRDVTQILGARWASCGDRDHLLAFLLKELGVPSRRIGFANVPYQGAHSASEVFLDDDWRFFDATTGFYFAAPGQDTPISIRQARQIYPAVQAFRTRLPSMPEEAKSVLDVAWRPAHLSPAYDAYGEIYCLPRENYFLSPALGGEVVAHDDFELAIDFREKWTWTFGQPGNLGAISSPMQSHGSIKLVPMLERLGKHNGGNTRHIFHLLAAHHLRVQLKVVLRDDQSADDLDATALHMVTPELMEPPFHEAKLVSKYFGGGSNVAVFDVHVLPPLTKLALSVPWSQEREVQFIGFQAFPGGRFFDSAFIDPSASGRLKNPTIIGGRDVEV